MSITRFKQAFDQYLAQIRQARHERRHHDYRRHLFTSFVRDAFGVEADELQLEEHVTAVRVRGFIDLLYMYLVFEFKRDLTAERRDGIRELTTYLSAISERRPLGVLTDGLVFEVYSLEECELRLVDSQDLERLSEDPESAYLWFEAYLFSARDAEPTPQDIVRRFGSRSAVFTSTRVVLRQMLQGVGEDPAVRVKYSEWDRLLSKVYGESVGTNELFVKHTYLAMLARLIAFVATAGRRPAGDDLLGVVDGQAFARTASNLVEADFFSWVLVEPARSRSLLSALVAHLGQYDLTRIGEMDILQRLYQDLVDPAERHDLGEYYTPDWLAELTLREAGFGPGKSLLDPACGSGTFLFTAIRLLVEFGLSPREITEWALENFTGVDVHPVAVLASKVNFVLALQRFGEPAHRGPITIPVYMADSLIAPSPKTGLVTIMTSENEGFHITEEMAATPNFDAAVDSMASLARTDIVNDEDADSGFRSWLNQNGITRCVTFWGPNARLMRPLVREGRDTIWAFIVKNAYRPLYLAQRKFDFVVGNPPWLAYRYIRDPGYRDEVRNHIFAYGLMERSQRQLFTQMEIATLFWTHSRTRFLAEGGVIAFVMPRSVITGARQHSRFREREPLSKILDLQHVDVPTEPSLKVFGVDSCVLVADSSSFLDEIPAVRFTGELPTKSLSYERATDRLAREDYVYRRPAEADPSDYLPRVLQGATIVPRGLWFATPTSHSGSDPAQPLLMTDPSVLARAKDAWTDLHVESRVEARFVYATLLSNDLLPFGTRKFSLAVLPLYKERYAANTMVLDARGAYRLGFLGLGSWMEQAERIWTSGRMRATQMPLGERLDYQRTLSDQDTSASHVVVYNRSGSHLSAFVARPSAWADAFQPIMPRGFAVDNGMYWVAGTRLDECHYLAAALNAPCVDAAITPHQTRGAYHGARDIHRRPFEVLGTPIPLYNPKSRAHRELADISRECHELVAASELSLETEIGRLRQRVRADLRPQLARIDRIVAEMLNLEPTPDL